MFGGTVILGGFAIAALLDRRRMEGATRCAHL